MPKNKQLNQENGVSVKRRRIEATALRGQDDEVSGKVQALDEGDLHVESLSEYERERLKNIQENDAFLTELNLNKAKQEFNDSIQTSKRQKVRGLSKSKKKMSTKERYGPRRQSLRLQRLDPVGEPLPKLPVATPAVEEHKLYFARAVKAVGLKQIKQYSSPRSLDECPRKPPGPLKMEPTNGVEQAHSDAFVCDLKNLSSELAEKQGHSRAHKPKHDSASSYEASLRRLRIKEEDIAKLVPQRIFSLAFHPSERKSIVFAGDKWGRLGVWDVNSSRGEDGVYLFEPHSRPINCMVVDPSDCTRLYTCSYDGSMRCCDVNAAAFQEVYYSADDVRFMHFAFGSPSARTVLVGDDNGEVLVVDTRIKQRHSPEQRYEVHHRTVKCLDVHPHNCNLFLTSSNDCTVALWDLRNMKDNHSRLSCAQRSRAVTSAYFSPLTGSQIVSASLDDYIAVYDIDSSGGLSTTPKCLFRHDNHVGRWLTNFRATWDPKSDTHFVVGSMSRPRQIDIYSSEKRSTAAMILRDENLNSINSLNVFHPTLNLLAGANSSGKVYFWTE